VVVDEALKAKSAAQLHYLVSQVSGVVAAVVSTSDGFEVASYVTNTSEVSKLAAMASSLTAIGAVIGEESKLGGLSCITVDAKNGFLVMVEVEHAQYPMILNVVAQKSAVLGQVLYHAKQVALSLAA
jgi:uncharacterized protein